MSDYNPNSKLLRLKLEYALRADDRVGAASFIELADVVSGAVTHRLNSASTLNLQIPSSDGRFTQHFHSGMRLRLRAEFESVTNAIPIFYGFIPSGVGVVPSDDSVNVFANGLLAQLENEHVYVGDYADSRYTRAGNEVSLAILAEVLALDLPSGEYGYIGKPTNPAVLVNADTEISSGWHSRKELVDYYCSLAIDESVPDAPREYAFCDSFATSIPNFHFFKMPDVEASNAVRTLDLASDIMSSVAKIKAQQATRCICASKGDSRIFETYESASLKRRYGTFTKYLEYPSTNRDLLLARARQYVAMNRAPIYSLQITLADVPSSFELGQVVQVTNAQRGFSGKYAITEIAFRFSTTTCSTTLTLASKRELVTDLLV